MSHEMLNIELLIEMSAESLQNFVTVLENLPQSVKVEIYKCDIKPETERERLINYIRSSHTRHVINTMADSIFIA